ncbi:protein adenylyltransferase SelO [Terasakiella pusilla]|uniref:protein adenylyltransferase SelO n=1 Tax=Terasakiella pusilla TaxID=64973 RepID=UPI00048E321A|nr:YdiU family protein [Terasakiella pusilla]
MSSCDTLGLNIENSYLSLPEHCYAKAQPAPIESPFLVIKNVSLAEELSLSFDQINDTDLAQVFCGNVVPTGATPISQAYAGHQFGNFTMLGDGRAHLIGEHVLPDGRKVDIQLKGSGRTPFSRGGDGKGAMGPMLREYIISEAMYGLGIPTTRSLAVVATGEPVYRKTVLPGAILTRVAASHVRVGTFQYAAAQGDTDTLKKLADFAIARHYPEVQQSETPYFDFLTAVMQRQIDLIVDWMRVGFIHGVMNTDNMAISGETIDYGPCAFMDAYDPQTVFSSIDVNGRYAFANQAPLANWNLARLAEAMLPLLDTDSKVAVKKAEQIIYGFDDLFQKAWLDMMCKKFGLFGEEDQDRDLVDGLLSVMTKQKMDYTNTFRALSTLHFGKEEGYSTEDFVAWLEIWQARQALNQPSPEASKTLMDSHNPWIIPRNHQVEEALELAEEEADLSKLHRLLDALASPYQEKEMYLDLTLPPAPSDRVYKTFCGT